MIIQLLAIFIIDWGVTAECNRHMLGLTGKEFHVCLLFFLQVFLFQLQLFLLVLYSCYLCLLYLDLMLVRKFLLQEFNRFLLPALFFAQPAFRLPIMLFSLSSGFLLKSPTSVFRHGHFRLSFRAVSLWWGRWSGWKVRFRHWRRVGFRLLVLYLLLPFPDVLLSLP